MPFLIAIAVAIVWILRKPLDERLKRRRIGPLIGAAIGVVLAIVWFRAAPPEIDLAYELGDVAGVLGVYLMVVALVLATRLVRLERWFGGLDQMYYWHRLAALCSVPLVALHVVGTQTGSRGSNELDSGPHPGEILGIVSGVLLLVLIAVSLPRVGRIVRLRYDRWLFFHRLTGLFVLLALVHAWLLDPVVEASIVARIALAGVTGVGVVAYAYGELIRRRVEAHASYVVGSVDRVSPEIVDVVLSPTGPSSILPVVAGQFVYLAFGAGGIPREHPFSVAGVAEDGSVRVTIRALGRDTRRIHRELREGTPARLVGPYGMFDFTVGGRRQIWIAGGIGIAPFLGWISREPGADLDIDLFYTAPSDAEMVFRDELDAAANHHPGLRFHPHHSRSQGRLTVAAIRDAIGPIAPGTHIFMCGPARMVGDFRHELHDLGVPRENIHAEHFAFR